MTGSELEERYRRYIARLNDRRVHELEDFVHDEVVYNGERLTRAGYQDLIAEAVAAIPDLWFDIRLLVASGDRVACRLLFECTPQRTFLGLEPSGKRVSFCEHVFYEFRDGRIAEVWSLIDRSALAAQLAG
ncbi:ester cyclase [Hansschlegelia zhihuaiae]|uniref:Ester cyclase n=1 Tax=Hansschlegelia zhihuaiae TaxID=405005 RepID=A0A4Q0MMW8_9HYPH|nr:ester cyclase [Hansschlegelia zhihuaiae]RXF74953.1 ester cyclase [Hansschlegelia zhihuaiae]